MSRGRRAPGAPVFAAVAIAAVAVAACGGGPAGSAPAASTPAASSSLGPAAATASSSPRADGSGRPAGLSAFDEGGLAFAYPAAWRLTHPQFFSTMSSSIADLALVDVPDPCVTTGNTTSCGARFRLEPNTLVVEIRSNGWPGFNILDPLPAGARPLVVGGLPAYRVESMPVDAAILADTVLTWTLAHPGSVDNYYTITASLRGPGLATMEGQLEAMIASLRFDPPAALLPAGSNAASTAAGTALAALARDTPAWRCFPATPGTGHLLVSTLPMGPELAVPQVATCTMRIEATRLQLWRMTLTLELPIADPNARRGSRYEVWVNPDGTPGQMSGGALAP